MAEFVVLELHRHGPRARWPSSARVLRRPEGERAFLVLPVGYPAPPGVPGGPARVPRIERKPLEEILVWNRGPRG